MTSSIVYAPVRAELDRTRRDHRAAQQRRLARRRARRRCEDLAELLSQMALRPRDPDQAADLLRRSLVAAREIERLVTGARGAPLADEAGDAEARRLAAELATTLAGGVEALVVTRIRP